CRVPAPDLRTGRGVHRLEERPHAVLRADAADVDLPVDIDRRRGDRLGELPLDELLLPEHLAGLLVERDDRAVELAEVDASITERDNAIEPAAADRRDLLRDPRGVRPEDLAARDADREDVVVARRDVDDALV